MIGNKKKRTRLLPMYVLHSRPCDVDGRPALFHRWVEEDRALLKIDALVNAEAHRNFLKYFNTTNSVPNGCSVEVIRETFALVEYRDGTVAKVKPELIRFTEEVDK